MVIAAARLTDENRVMMRAALMPACADEGETAGGEKGGFVAGSDPLHLPPNERSIVPMNARTTSSPTEGALRASTEIETDGSRREATANVIDRESGLRELSQILEEIIAEAGDLIEGRSPELLTEARAALRRSADSAPRQ